MNFGISAGECLKDFNILRSDGIEKENRGISQKEQSVLGHMTNSEVVRV